MIEKTIYQFSAERLTGDTVKLEEYRGKVLLIVNTASQCGFTPQLEDLETLRGLYLSNGFEILAFPSNDFGQQEPLTGDAIQEFCQVNYGVSFPVFNKISVKGKDAHPLFRFLANKRLNGSVSAVPRWNFYKYLINQNGQVSDFFYPFTKPSSGRIKRKIDQLLNTKN
ncbi:glutathione peroxidase [Pedobacter sp. SYSU D00535]|uniref:glutathione peroxidase n=1 Tax=Pedobacter sp. SYSU D00535 TaxID=2810308 RepID=UPI001A9688E2|nr:glutathione peroxidase [Pedobacter sp. SYSU D00535]